MRVPRTPTELLSRRPREKPRPGAPARRRAEGRSEAPVAPAPAPKDAVDLRQERRMRESGGPDDRAYFRCSCGYAFEAPVSTSVACPHCGTGQAW